MIADRILADIDAAAKRRDFASCQTSIETLIELWQDADEPRLPAAAAVPVAKALRGQRQFKSVIALSEAWQHLPLQDDPPAQDLFLYRSQALIEEGLLDQAIDEMRARINDFAPGSHQHAEAWGRLGRAFKQRYVDAKGAGDCATLLQAIGAYAEIARRNGNEETDLTRYHWHEVNLIALTARAEMDGCDPGHDLDSATWARGLADRLEANIDTSPRDLMWKLASLGECYVAMAQYARAGEVYRRYLAHPDMELFECTASLRQLEEVWRLGGSSGTPDNPEAAALLKALRERIDALAAERLHGDTPASTVGLTAAESSRLERFDRNAPATSSARLPSRPIGFTRIHTMARRLRAVTLIRDRLDHWIYGTGFFVRGSELAPWLGDDAYMLTNAHVLGRTDARALPIDDAMLDIWDENTGRMRHYPLDHAEIAWESRELDATLVRLAAAPASLECMPIAEPAAMARTLDELPAARRRCIFVGAMLGQQVGTDFIPCTIEDIGWRSPEPGAPVYIYHRSRTEPGSSGSPILDLDYNVVGLHRAGGSEGKTRTGLPPLNGFTHNVFAEEAVSLLSIKQALEASGHKAAAERAEHVETDDEPDLPGEDEALSLYFEYDEENSRAFEPVLRERPGHNQERAFRETCEWFLVDAASSIFSSRRFAAARRIKERGKHRFIAASDGDSWFQFPIPGVPDVIDHLSTANPVFCHAMAGNQLAEVSGQVHQRVLKSIEQFDPDIVLLSGGGNDVLGDGRLTVHVADFDPSRGPKQHITPALDTSLDMIMHHYRNVVTACLGKKPSLRLFLHGYDWALPREGGRILWKPLKQIRRIEDITFQRAIIKEIVSRLNARLQTLEDEFKGHVHFVDCRGAVGSNYRSWYDEIHPKGEGFRRVAHRFDQRIGEVLGR